MFNIYEIEVNSDEVVETIEIDNVVNCGVDSKEVQCSLLCSKQYSIENFENNSEAVQYYTCRFWYVWALHDVFFTV